MERWGARGAAPEQGRPGRRYADQPSFSSTLLDAIYRSMDEPNDGTAANKTKKREDYSHYYKASLAGSYRASSRVTTAPHATTSSSSDCSSYGGFSSSEADSSSQHGRLRPIRTSVAAAAVPDKKAKTKPGAAIRATLRDLRSKPASPGARLAGFLNSIFAGKQRGGPATPPPRAVAESACSTASSRSCLSKTPSTRSQPKRTVRFLDSDVEATPASAVERRGVQLGVVHLERMLLRRMEMESDDDDDDEEESSDASSDLFELENLAAVAPAVAGPSAAYRDELPVYETTRVVRNRGIGHGHGYAHGRSTRVV